MIIAAPFHGSSLTVNLANNVSTPVIPPQPYVHLYVTLLSTPNPSPRTRFFGLDDKASIPSMVLTTWERARATGGEEKPEFNSLSYHGRIRSREDGATNLTALGVGEPEGRGEDGEEWSVKIFSDHPIEDRWLRRAFGKIGWVYRKEVRDFVVCYVLEAELMVCVIVGCLPCASAYRHVPTDQTRQGIVLREFVRTVSGLSYPARHRRNSCAVLLPPDSSRPWRPRLSRHETSWNY